MYFIIARRVGTRSHVIVKSAECMSEAVLWQDIFQLLRPYDCEDGGIVVVLREGSIWVNKYGEYCGVYGDRVCTRPGDRIIKVEDWIKSEDVRSIVQLQDYLDTYYNIQCSSKELFTLGIKLYGCLSKSTDKDCLLIHNLFQKATIPTDKLST